MQWLTNGGVRVTRNEVRVLCRTITWFYTHKNASVHQLLHRQGTFIKNRLHRWVPGNQRRQHDGCWIMQGGGECSMRMYLLLQKMKAGGGQVSDVIAEMVQIVT